MSEEQKVQEKKEASVEPRSGEESVGGSSPEGSRSHDQSPELEPVGRQPNEEELIPVPPPTPKSGVSILAHKIWIGNLDKRLTE